MILSLGFSELYLENIFSLSPWGERGRVRGEKGAYQAFHPHPFPSPLNGEGMIHFPGSILTAFQIFPFS